MKTNLIYMQCLFSLIAVMGSADDLVLTGVISAGSMDIVELYTPIDIPDLGRYRIEVTNTGVSNLVKTFRFIPEFFIPAGSFIYVSKRSTLSGFFGCYTVFFYKTSSISFVGDDEAVTIYKDGKVHDRYGDIVEVSSSPQYSWNYRMGWAHRKNNTGPDGDFVERNWDSHASVFSNTNDNWHDSNLPYPLATFGKHFVY
ncbi:unnamed protein product [Owenia fusiformis]|uniref:Uncharacterized protein n=1 Tax=Owenia fusiformis TaxID=6347 RepID=A0A8J1XTJ8_OWEFU|nr:unnamed protein product [Owenia fusiformis]